MSTYTIRFSGSRDGTGAAAYPEDRPFHSALGELLATEGPVSVTHLSEDIRAASAAGAFIDPFAIAEALALAITIFAESGDLDVPPPRGSCYGAPASVN